MNERKKLIDDAIKLVEVYGDFDETADAAEDAHIKSIEALQAANERANLDNLAAEQQLLADEAFASAAYDQALQAAKLKRETVRQDAQKLVIDAQIEEGTKMELKNDARAKVAEIFEAIKLKLEEAAAAKDVIEPAPTPEPAPVPVPEPTPVQA